VGNGKTKFLYSNILRGNYSNNLQENPQIYPTLGYNFEIMPLTDEEKYGFWDLSGDPIV